MDILIVDAPLQYPVIRARSGCQLLPSGNAVIGKLRPPAAHL
ncbi:hypothetical protein HDF12_004503 [Edaphobacter lichenicola]|uniref:Uncharacterized protein n=1 Tax=Tunturiibacter lichenicola TaxID=2051959 RepID=A0A7Y9NR91_9BACT|nr:hypothetical protein [Edaphobacter lichenicola]